MTTSCTAFNILLALVRAGLWLDPAQLTPMTASRPLSDEIWQEVLQAALRESVVGLACRGAAMLPDGLTPPQQVGMRLVAETDRIERNARILQAGADELTAALTQHGIRALVLKGPAVAAFYADPLLRTTGDIDLFIPSEHFAAAQQLLFSRSPLHHQGADGSCCYLWKGMRVELTPRRFSLDTKFEQRFAAFAAASPCPDVAATMLLLSSHIFKHAAGYGIGLKQLCDLARARTALVKDISEEALASVWSSFGMTRWNRTLEAFLWLYLGGRDHLPMLAAPASCAARSAAVLLRHIRRDGNFGLDHRRPGKMALAGCFARNAAFCLPQSPVLYGHVVHTYLGRR